MKRYKKLRKFIQVIARLGGLGFVFIFTLATTAPDNDNQALLFLLIVAVVVSALLVALKYLLKQLLK